MKILILNITSTLKKIGYLIFIFLLVNCKKNNVKSKVLFKYNNLEVKTYYDFDSILKLIFYDVNNKFIYTTETNNNKEPNFIIKDFNNDNLNDLLILSILFRTCISICV